MRKLLLVQFIFALSMACSAMAEEEDAYVFWKDPQIAQLEELTSKLVDSVQKCSPKSAQSQYPVFHLEINCLAVFVKLLLQDYSSH